MLRKSLAFAAAAVVLGAGLLSGTGTNSVDAAHSGAVYRVTIENLTTGQPLSPGNIVTHSADASLWTVGEASSAGLQAIAENGDPAVMAGELSGVDAVHRVVTLGAPILPGASATAYIDGTPGDLLSIAVMLICTNDGFTGVNALTLPASGSESVESMAYDGGTEENSELSTDIVDPCGAAGPISLPEDGNGRTAEDGTVQPHPGIDGDADLDADEHGWTGAVARVTVEVVETTEWTLAIDNLTGGQPFSPPLVVTHTADADVFTVGEAASEGVRLIAEQGSPAELAAALNASPQVYSVETFGGPILAGASASITIHAPVGARVSVVTMLICTNDGITGLDSQTLSSGSHGFDANAYDAGTEQNTELSTDIVDPCGAAGPVALPEDGNERPAESGVITMHPGISGDADLSPSEHGWTGPVARIVVSDGSLPEPTATATATNVPPTTVPATATPTREAPMPPNTGSGTQGGSPSSFLVLFAAAAVIAAGMSTVALKRRRS